MSFSNLLQVQVYAEKCQELEAELQCLAEGSGLISPQTSTTAVVPTADDLRKEVYELEEQLLHVRLESQKTREQHQLELTAAVERAEEQQQK